ncbi:hypothetical protein ICN41_07680 [Polynucleobacter sp. 15G-AUS-farblos]|uniref:hypothetical protein n=1 Tax=Polynucleobacter sp. 15G-AUS-farblos TaxID=2689094 RepID=UPI001C0E1433|nr:hypothetical protein [Polynucleobacter sp. 15G-AUS-farblos]MBU3583872.1 hypothetical protein [Polynucleobacter sp. 15G-AUS-farblos]
MNFAPKQKRKQTAYEWVDYLRESEGLGGILAKTEDLAKVKSQLARALTALDLGQFSQKIEAGWRQGGQNELFLLVKNASIASRLQQVLPSLINELAKNGLICKSIKLQVKPQVSNWDVKARTEARAPRKPTGLNQIARSSWQDLLEKLDPESGLRKAVEKLLQNKPK